MPAANIEINGSAASQNSVPLDTTVQLSNADIGGESSYLWEVISQPEGPADALSAPNIENPTITPQKEDTYLVQLTVNAGLPDEVVDRKVFRVRRLVSDSALIASQEDTEGVEGSWAFPQNQTLARHDNAIYDGTVIAAVANEALTFGQTVEFRDVITIKSGLPGEARLPGATRINATDGNIGNRTVGVVLGTPAGDAAVGIGEVVLVRIYGYLDGITYSSGSPGIGDEVYVSDAGLLDNNPGSNDRIVGFVVDDSAGAWRVFLAPWPA